MFLLLDECWRDRNWPEEARKRTSSSGSLKKVFVGLGEKHTQLSRRLQVSLRAPTYSNTKTGRVLGCRCDEHQCYKEAFALSMPYD